MARITMELAFISAERVKFEAVDLLKIYLGDEPDGEKDLGLSLLSMRVADPVRDEVWASCKAFDVLEPVRVTVDVERGSKNAGKFIVLHVESAHSSHPVKPSLSPNAQAKPDASKP